MIVVSYNNFKFNIIQRFLLNSQYKYGIGYIKTADNWSAEYINARDTITSAIRIWNINSGYAGLTIKQYLSQVLIDWSITEL